MHSRVALLLALSAALFGLSCNRYDYRSQGNQLVRIDRISGRTEVLRRDFVGRDRWVTAAEPQAPPATAPAPPPTPQDEEREMLPSELAALRVEATWAKAASSFVKPQLSIAVTNPTVMDITEMRVRVEYDGTAAAAPYVTTVKREGEDECAAERVFVRAGQEAAFDIDLPDDFYRPAPRWSIAGAKGCHQRDVGVGPKSSLK